MKKAKPRVKSKKTKPSSKKSKRQKPPALFPEKDLLSLKEASRGDLETLFKLTDRMKKAPGDFLGKLKGKSITLLFQKPSIRTRVSFQVGASELGSSSVYMGPEELPLGQRESIKDVARVLSRYTDAVVTRTYLHSDAVELARYAGIPVVNGLSDLFHPCQTLADLYTIREKFGELGKVHIAYVGDSNNVLNSLLYGVSKMGGHLSIAAPRGYEPNEEILKDIKLIAKESGSKITLSNNPFTAVKNAQVIYTDVWVSMGQEKQKEQRLRDFQPFQINGAIVGKAPREALIMHCLPAHRGEEITDEVIESPRSIIFDQAENRLHTQKALLVLLLTRKSFRQAEAVTQNP
ncbi:MAG: ornithine carbamoyltransferase [Candidatus Omnitrophica bacterium]|nr:ornithine carbamoyltransferase [Candidatus Omnitrophota bacterium]